VVRQSDAQGDRAASHRSEVARFSGWSFVLSGLVYAGLWTFAPISLAVSIGSGVVVAGAIAALGHCLWLAARAQTENDTR
jgi:hypothetical protein